MIKSQEQRFEESKKISKSFEDEVLKTGNFEEAYKKKHDQDHQFEIKWSAKFDQMMRDEESIKNQIWDTNIDSLKRKSVAYIKKNFH